MYVFDSVVQTEWCSRDTDTQTFYSFTFHLLKHYICVMNKFLEVLGCINLFLWKFAPRIDNVVFIKSLTCSTNTKILFCFQEVNNALEETSTQSVNNIPRYNLILTFGHDHLCFMVSLFTSAQISGFEPSVLFRLTFSSAQ